MGACESEAQYGHEGFVKATANIDARIRSVVSQSLQQYPEYSVSAEVSVAAGGDTTRI
jgi:hypothetical protein